MLSREQIHRAIDGLSETDLQEVAAFVDYLRYRQYSNDNLKRMVESFSHVQQAVEDAGMSEDEINQLIASSVAEVRRDSAP